MRRGVKVGRWIEGRRKGRIRKGVRVDRGREGGTERKGREGTCKDATPPKPRQRGHVGRSQPHQDLHGHGMA